jgi:3'-phosphoadenosine 5'-phosphosulfate (PAPS) 3'-phosphatase
MCCISDERQTNRDLQLAVGDYSAQAVINTILSRVFPHDPIVGEETSPDIVCVVFVISHNQLEAGKSGT